LINLAFLQKNNTHIEEFFAFYLGTTRITAYSYKCFSCILCFVYKKFGSLNVSIKLKIDFSNSLEFHRYLPMEPYLESDLQYFAKPLVSIFFE
jgi:hypothetical protein